MEGVRMRRGPSPRRPIHGIREVSRSPVPIRRSANTSNISDNEEYSDQTDLTDEYDPGKESPDSSNVHLEGGESPTCNTANSTASTNLNTSSKNRGVFWGSMTIGAVVVLMAAYFMCGSEGSKFINKNEENLKRSCSFNLLRHKYPQEDEYLWKSLRVVTEGVLNNDPATPGVYLFLHSDSELAQDLIWGIANTTAKCFNTSQEPLKLGKQDFTSDESMKDYGVIIKKYKDIIQQGGALIVANLNEIPGQAAKALHAICDTYSPIVRRVMIFMTLIADEHQGLKSDIKIAEDALYSQWGESVGRNELDSLIARVTDQVFRIRTK